MATAMRGSPTSQSVSGGWFHTSPTHGTNSGGSTGAIGLAGDGSMSSGRGLKSTSMCKYRASLSRRTLKGGGVRLLTKKGEKKMVRRNGMRSSSPKLELKKGHRDRAC